MEIVDIEPSLLAAAMTIPLDRLWEISRNPERFYHPPRVEVDKKGKSRTFEVPKYPLMKQLRQLHSFLQRELRFPRPAHGGVRGRSTLSSARKHCGQAVVITRDAKDCFPSISKRRLRRELIGLGFRPDTAQLLSSLLTIRDHVPQGSPTSNDAVNLFFWRQDLAISLEVGRAGGRYSRVADDLVASMDGRLGSEAIAATTVEAALESLGLTVNEKKKQDHGSQKAEGSQHVHGLLVNSGSGLRPSTKHLQEALEAGQGYVAAARMVDHSSITEVGKKRATLQGWIGYCGRTARGNVKHLRHLLKAGDRHVERQLTIVGLQAHRRRWWVKSKHILGPEKLATVWQNRLDRLAASSPTI